MTAQKFRLYFLCHVEKGDDDRHVHLSNHQGYKLRRPLEFFQKYGDFVLRVLTMIKYGLSTDAYNVPSLETHKILWGDQSKAEGSFLFPLNIGPLVDKAITYLQELSPPQWNNIHMQPGEAKEVPQYLHIHVGDNPFGNLHRCIDAYDTAWKCRFHSCPDSKSEGLSQLERFIHNLGGHVNLTQATIRTDLGSEQQAGEFFGFLSGTKHKFDVSVKLGWSANRSFLGWILEQVSLAGASSLEIEGITPKQQSLHHIDHGHNVFEIPFGSQMRTSLLNYPRPSAQYVHFRGGGVVYGLQFEHSPNSQDFDWLGIREALSVFWGVMNNTRHDVLAGQIEAIKTLEVELERHHIFPASEVSYYRPAVFNQNELRATIYLKENAVRKQVYNRWIPRPLSPFTLQLTVDAIEPEIDNVFETNPGLQQLNIMTQESRVLQQLESVIQLWQDRPGQIQLALFERCMDTRGRILAQVDIIGFDHQSIEGTDLHNSTNTHGKHIQASSTQSKVSILSPPIAFSQWNCDRVAEQLSDLTSPLFKLASIYNPSALQTFTLDISLLSQKNVSLVEGVLGRSQLERLIIVCHHVENAWRNDVCQILAAGRCSPIKSVEFSGDSVDEWLQLWASSGSFQETNTPPFGGCLHRLEITGSGAKPRALHIQVHCSSTALSIQAL